MGYLVIKKKKGIPYLYEQATFREGGKVRTKNRYLGRFVDQQAAVIQEEGTAFLVERTTYRPKGKKAEVIRIDKKGPASPEEIAAFLEKRPPHQEETENRTGKGTPVVTTTLLTDEKKVGATRSHRVQITADLSRLDLERANFGREYLAFFGRLDKGTAIDADRLPSISIKTGSRTEGKKKLFGSGYAVTVSRYRNQWHRARELKREFRRTLARAGLDFLKKNRPEIFRELSRGMQASFKEYKTALADYTRNTKDRNATAKAVAVKRGYFRRTYQNPLKLHELGRVDDRHYKDWKDEFCSIVAEVQTQGFDKVLRRFRGELHKAQRSHRHALEIWKETKPYHLAVIGERRRRLKRAAAREEAIKKSLKKLETIKRVLKY